MSSITGESFVNGVIHHLIYQMVKTFYRNIAYIHGRTLTYGLQTFEHLNITGAIFFFFFCHLTDLLIVVSKTLLKGALQQGKATPPKSKQSY